MRLAHFIPSWIERSDAWLAERGYTREQIVTGSDAWAVASRAGLSREAYDFASDVYDGHIQTALGKVFPNAVFKDAKRY
jgi:hypothetical protein